MIVKALVVFLALSPLAHAERKAEIFCKAKTPIADAGSIIEIEKQDNGGLRYTFTKNSFAGPRVAAQFAVTVEATKPGLANCELDITKISDGSHRFFVKQTAGKNWQMVLPKEQKDGELKCEVKESLRAQLCGAGKGRESAPALCDEANKDSSGCSGSGSAD